MNSEYNFHVPGVFVPKIRSNIIKRATLDNRALHYFHKLNTDVLKVSSAAVWIM